MEAERGHLTFPGGKEGLVGEENSRKVSRRRSCLLKEKGIRNVKKGYRKNVAERHRLALEMN